MFYSCIMLGIIQMVFFALKISICQSYINVSNVNDWSYISFTSAFIIYSVLIAHLFLSWLSRLYHTFNKSIYAKSNAFYKIFSIIFIFIVIFFIVGMILIMLFNVHSIKLIGVILVTTSGFMYFFAVISLLKAFEKYGLWQIFQHFQVMENI